MEFKNSIILLFFPTFLFGVSVGDRLYVKATNHAYYGQTGTVVKIESGGNTNQAKIDFDGDGVKDSQIIIEFTHSYRIVNDPPSTYSFVPSDVGRWIFASPNFYKIISLNGTQEAQAARGISDAFGNGFYIPPSPQQLTFNAEYKDTVWSFSDVTELPNYERNETRTWYYGYTEDFSDTGWGNVGEYRFVVKLTVTAQWTGFSTGNLSWIISIDDYSIVAHNIPEEHFKVGINTWRLSDIKENQPITGQTSQLGSNVYLPTISGPIPDNITSYSNLSANRDLTLYYTVTFNLLLYDGVQGEPYSFYHTIPVSIRWDYQE